uniref:Uncharacterized protein n=1 Tax=Ditylenchus dipsaci TaxID=166011 RepID=A0A915E015_9BILA
MGDTKFVGLKNKEVRLNQKLVIYRIRLRESQLLCVQKNFVCAPSKIFLKRNVPQIGSVLQSSLLHWMVFLALLFSSIGGINAAPIIQNNAVFVLDDKNKLAFTLFRPKCLEDSGSLIEAGFSFQNGCDLKMEWSKDSKGVATFNIITDDRLLKVDGSQVQFNLDAESDILFWWKSYFGSLQVQATDESKRPSPTDVYSSASNSLSTLAIVGIVLGVSAFSLYLVSSACCSTAICGRRNAMKRRKKSLAQQFRNRRNLSGRPASLDRRKRPRLRSLSRRNSLRKGICERFLQTPKL